MDPERVGHGFQGFPGLSDAFVSTLPEAEDEIPVCLGFHCCPPASILAKTSLTTATDHPDARAAVNFTGLGSFPSLTASKKLDLDNPPRR